MIVTRKDLAILAFTTTVGAIIGTIVVGVVVIELTKRNAPGTAGILNWLNAGINGVDGATASL